MAYRPVQRLEGFEFSADDGVLLDTNRLQLFVPNNSDPAQVNEVSLGAKKRRAQSGSKAAST